MEFSGKNTRSATGSVEFSAWGLRHRSQQAWIATGSEPDRALTAGLLNRVDRHFKLVYDES